MLYKASIDLTIIYVSEKNTLRYTDCQDELGNPPIQPSRKTAWRKWQHDRLETTWALCITGELQVSL